MDSAAVRVTFWSVAIAKTQHLSQKLDEKASVSPEAMKSRDEDLRGVFGVEEEDEAQERPEKRQRVAEDQGDAEAHKAQEGELDEEEQELHRSGVFDGEEKGDKMGDDDGDD